MTPQRTFALGVVGAVSALMIGCVWSPASRMGDYLSGVPVPPQSQPVTTPLRAGLVLALPETELGKSTTPNKAVQDTVMGRIKKEFQNPEQIEITQVLPPIRLQGQGQSSLTIKRLREAAQGTGLTKLFVVVATSTSAQRMLPYPLYEVQLFVRMDLALVDLTTGQVLLTEVGQEDYDMEDRYDGVKHILYPRIFYRSLTRWAGPFELVEGDPYVALGEKTFSGAADQLAMHLRQKLNEGDGAMSRSLAAGS